MADAANYFDKVRVYTADVNEKAVVSIVKHLGIALQSRDASMVACSDPFERERVREKWLKKKLGLKESNDVLDAAILDVCQTMSADFNKCRVVFYYLLAKKYGKLGAL